MNIRDVEIRLDFLIRDMERAETMRKNGETPSALGYDEYIARLRGRIEEMMDWKDVLSKHPQYGSMIRSTNGSFVPLLPTFGKREYPKNTTAEGMTEEDTMRAREWHAAKNAQAFVFGMNGKSPELMDGE